MPSAATMTTDQVRIRVILENTPGAPVKEFTLTEKLTCESLSTRVLALAMTSFPNEKKQDPKQFNIELRYHSEGTNQSWFIDFDDDESLEFAIQSSKGEGYVLFSASVLKKGAVVAAPPPVVTTPFPVRSRSTPKAVKKPKAAKKSKTTKHKALSSATKAGGKMSVEEKILAAMKELDAIGIDIAPRKQVALFSGYSCLTSKGFANAISKLKIAGLVEYPDSKTARLTAAGSAKAGTVEAPKSNREVQDRIKMLLQPKACQILNFLSDGRAHPREDVAKAIGYTCLTSKGFSNSLSKMSSLGILEYPKESNSKIKLVQLTEIAFPFGRGSSNSSVVSNDASSSDDEEMAVM